MKFVNFERVSPNCWYNVHRIMLGRGQRTEDQGVRPHLAGKDRNCLSLGKGINGLPLNIVYASTSVKTHVSHLLKISERSIQDISIK